MTLGNVRSLGPRSLDVQCKACDYHTTVNVDNWPNTESVPAFGPYAVQAMRPPRRQRAAGLDAAPRRARDTTSMTVDGSRYGQRPFQTRKLRALSVVCRLISNRPRMVISSSMAVHGLRRSTSSLTRRRSQSVQKLKTQPNDWLAKIKRDLIEPCFSTQ
jgi:hypothetical protein